MGLRAAGVHFSPNAERAIAALEESKDREAPSILRRVRAMVSVLGADILHGEVARHPLPKPLVSEYGLENLYVEDLPSFWRLLYTNVRRGNERHVVVVEIVEHAIYDKWFPGRGR